MSVVFIIIFELYIKKQNIWSANYYLRTKNIYNADGASTTPIFRRRNFCLHNKVNR